jgi:hypothetical protein
MPGWRILRRKTLDSKGLEALQKKPFVWVPDSNYPEIYPTNIAAKRAYCVALEPERANHPDDMIRRQFRSWAVNLGHVKLERVP